MNMWRMLLALKTWHLSLARTEMTSEVRKKKSEIQLDSNKSTPVAKKPHHKITGWFYAIASCSSRCLLFTLHHVS